MWARGMTAGPWICTAFIALKLLKLWIEGETCSVADDWSAVKQKQNCLHFEGGAQNRCPRAACEAAS